MNITQEDSCGPQTVLHIELEDEDLDPYLDRGYKRVVQSTSIPGFRKGKAPRIVVERYVGRESLLDAVADFMVTDVTARAIDAQNLEDCRHAQAGAARTGAGHRQGYRCS